MKLKLTPIFDYISDSFWVLPAFMAFVAGLAALGSVAIDYQLNTRSMQNLDWFLLGSVDGARGVLSVVAGSVMTVVSIVLSLTISVLAQTSSHFGPRVLRNFTSDRKVQVTIGTFIATFIYCVMVLRTIRSIEESVFIPYLSVNIGVLMALASLAVLIFFIHYISQMIQAENLIAAVGEDFQNNLCVLFPERMENSQKNQNDLNLFSAQPNRQNTTEIHALNSGYIQRIDCDHLMQLAIEYDGHFQLEKRSGDFVSSGTLLLKVNTLTTLTKSHHEALCACFSTGRHRTPYQDALYSIQQLVEIAAHALSPGINEPFTALTCIDWLGDCLRGVAARELPTDLHFDDSGVIRIIAKTLNFDDITGSVFNQIRLYGASNPDVMLHLLKIIADVIPVIHRAGDRDILIQHSQLIGFDAMTHIKNAADQQRVKQRLQAILKALA